MDFLTMLGVGLSLTFILSVIVVFFMTAFKLNHRLSEEEESNDNE